MLLAAITMFAGVVVAGVACVVSAVGTAVSSLKSSSSTKVAPEDKIVELVTFLWLGKQSNVLLLLLFV